MLLARTGFGFLVQHGEKLLVPGLLPFLLLILPLPISLLYWWPTSACSIIGCWTGYYIGCCWTLE